MSINAAAAARCCYSRDLEGVYYYGDETTTTTTTTKAIILVGCVAQLAERRSLAGELTLSCARPAADG